MFSHIVTKYDYENPKPYEELCVVFTSCTVDEICKDSPLQKIKRKLSSMLEPQKIDPFFK